MAQEKTKETSNKLTIISKTYVEERRNTCHKDLEALVRESVIATDRGQLGNILSALVNLVDTAREDKTLFTTSGLQWQTEIEIVEFLSRYIKN
jgi:hypothetical protein